MNRAASMARCSGRSAHAELAAQARARRPRDGSLPPVPQHRGLRARQGRRAEDEGRDSSAPRRTCGRRVSHDPRASRSSVRARSACRTRTSRSPTSSAPARGRRSRGRSSECSRSSSSPRCAPLSTDWPATYLIYLIKSMKMARLSATETARNFSAILNRVATGEEFEITRNGTTIAVIGPPRISSSFARTATRASRVRASR